VKILTRTLFFSTSGVSSVWQERRAPPGPDDPGGHGPSPGTPKTVLLPAPFRREQEGICHPHAGRKVEQPGVGWEEWTCQRYSVHPER